MLSPPFRTATYLIAVVGKRGNAWAQRLVLSLIGVDWRSTLTVYGLYKAKGLVCHRCSME